MARLKQQATMGLSLFKRTIDALAAMHHKPTKKLGQNFLVDENVVEKFVRIAGLATGDSVVEIGPGLGAISTEILKYGAKLFAIELDSKLFEFLSAYLEGNGNFSPMSGDAVAFPAASLPTGCRDYKIVANLPYAISSPWFDAILCRENLPESIAVIVQLDAANRFLAQHGTKAFGPMAIFLQSAYDKTAMRRISRNSFHPSPDVDSAMLFLTRRECPFVFPQRTRQIIREIFTNRRKQIAKISAEHGLDLVDWLARNGIAPRARPEQIAIKFWQDIPSQL
jgi:16S rRNA (adenine1518-N6/adenine1519-N6)-dimethyltransferase